MPASLPFALDPGRPVLIAGPTASGKSALALQIAREQGGVIINADALQVFDGWRLLTARPTDADLSTSPHLLYGHVPFEAAYSVGQWLRDIAPLLSGPMRPIIVGGTGLYFNALTKGLVDIPPTPTDVRAAANALSRETLLGDLSPKARAALDPHNRARVQRAWEVRQATGRDLCDWHADTPPPLLPPAAATRLVMDVPVDRLNDRIALRFDVMLAMGALEEARAMLPHWNPDLLSSKAIGAADLIAHLRGDQTMAQARDAAVTASRQYAKRQRTWFRSNMADWQPVAKLSTD